MRPYAYRSDHASMAVGIGSEILQAQRCTAGVLDIAIDETDRAGLVVKIKISKRVSGVLLEATIDDLSRIADHQAGLTTQDLKRRVRNRQPFRQIRVVREEAAAIADGKTGWNQFHKAHSHSTLVSLGPGSTG